MRNNNFDFLRFYFAFIVLVAHIIVISEVEAFKKHLIFFDTNISITAFFCISGFLISASYQKSTSLKSYLKKRIARILPAYVFVVLSCVLLLSFVSNYSFAEYFSAPQLYKYLITNLSFLNFIEPCLPGVFNSDILCDCSVNGALWTLKIEVGFYLIIPILFYFIIKIKRKYIFLLIIYILSIIYRYILHQLSATADNNMFSTLARQLPGFMSYFACGLALHFYFDFFIKNKKWFLLAGAVLFIFEEMIGWRVFTPFALSAIVFAIAYSFKYLNNFGKYGDISYGIYIYHCPIIKLATDWGYFERYNPYLVAFAIMAIVVVIGFLSWHLLEKKFLKR